MCPGRLFSRGGRIAQQDSDCLLTVPASLTTIASLARTHLCHLITSHQLAVRRTCKS